MEEQTAANGSYNIFRTILSQLCVNFHEYILYQSEWECEMRSNIFYELKSLKGRTLRFTTLQKLPLSGAIEDENGKLRGIGIAFELIHKMQDKIGFFYNITLPDKNIIGNENEGVVQMLKEKKVDMAVAFLPIMHAFQDVISFSTVLTEFEWVLFMARPTASADNTKLLAPFEGQVWALILLSLIIAGPLMYIIVYLSIKFESQKHPTGKPYSLDACVWFVYGALMKQGSTLNPIYDSPRLFFATWWIFITILTSFYTANLTAFLTLSQFTLPIQTTGDIYRQNRRWFTDEGGYEEYLINVENSFEYLKETLPKYGRFTLGTVNQRFQYVLQGEIYVCEKRKAEKLMLLNFLNATENEFRGKKRCPFVATPQSILSKSMSFAYQKNSKLKPLFDPVLEIFVSGGILTHLLDSQIPLSTVCPLKLSNKDRKLVNEDLRTTYEMSAIGFGLASAAFLGELIFRFIKIRRNEKKGIGQGAEANRFYESQISKIHNIIFVSEKKKKLPTLSENFFIQEYYNEIMPYTYRDNKNDFPYVKSTRNEKLVIEPKNILYQFLH